MCIVLSESFNVELFSILQLAFMGSQVYLLIYLHVKQQWPIYLHIFFQYSQALFPALVWQIWDKYQLVDLLNVQTSMYKVTLQQLFHTRHMVQIQHRSLSSVVPHEFGHGEHPLEDVIRLKDSVKWILLHVTSGRKAAHEQCLHSATYCMKLWSWTESSGEKWRGIFFSFLLTHFHKI